MNYNLIKLKSFSFVLQFSASIFLFFLSFNILNMTTALAADILSTAPLGWSVIPNTKIRSVCPPSNNLGDCAGVTKAWNSAVFDSKRNRLIVWGGGHQDYLGNEIYALNLNATPITITRITDPSTKTIQGQGSTGDVPPQASSRHTYDHIIYMSHIDGMFVFGGASPILGFMLDDTWVFNFSTMAWIKKNPVGTKPEGDYGRVTAYNPVTQKVYIHDQFNLYSYTYETDTYSILSSDPPLGQDRTGVFDSKRQLFISIGNGQVTAYDVSAGSKYAKQTWATTGGSSILNAPGPGVAYDPISDRIVAWTGGNTVYTLDPAATTKVWTPITYSGGPGAAIAAGTYKRFAYSPSSNAFVVVNSVDSDAYALKLTLGGGGGSPPIQITAPKNLRVS